MMKNIHYYQIKYLLPEGGKLKIEAHYKGILFTKSLYTNKFFNDSFTLLKKIIFLCIMMVSKRKNLIRRYFMQRIWGKGGQLEFKDDNEYYEVLGELCHSDLFHITFETNIETNSWGNAFRIKCNVDKKQLTDAFKNSIRDANRINCNEYVTNLYQNHNFDFDKKNKKLYGDYDKVKKSIPDEFLDDFEKGYKKY